VESETQSLDAEKALFQIESSQSNTPTEDVITDSLEDFSLGLSLEDNDFLSTNGLGNGGSSYPEICFGGSQDGEDEDATDTEESFLSRSRVIPRDKEPRKSSTGKKLQRRTLYIQMEYVSGQTLREVIFIRPLRPMRFH